MMNDSYFYKIGSPSLLAPPKYSKYGIRLKYATLYFPFYNTAENRIYGSSEYYSFELVHEHTRCNVNVVISALYIPFFGRRRHPPDFGPERYAAS